MTLRRAFTALYLAAVASSLVLLALLARAGVWTVIANAACSQVRGN
ncbi:MAG: hypothetical protein KGM49_00465 [Sphingomonadales bacterium]|nr:hypothetical protein [Sphingomonadales bacterium]